MTSTTVTSSTMTPTPASTLTSTGGAEGSEADPNLSGSLTAALDRFEAAPHDSIMGSRQVINMLLDLWADTQAEGPEVARPVEQLLTRLVTRQYTTPAELDAMTDEIRLVAAHR